MEKTSRKHIIFSEETGASGSTENSKLAEETGASGSTQIPSSRTRDLPKLRELQNRVKVSTSTRQY